MGFWNNFGSLFRGRPAQPGGKPSAEVCVGATDSEKNVSLTFNDRNITYGGDLTDFDYEAILRDKQRNINQLYQLADYYVDADPIFRGIIKEVYTPFSIADRWILVGSNEAVKKKYEEYYERIHLLDKMESIFLQFYKYGNVYVYLMPNGNIITLPVHLIRIGNVMVAGEAVIEMNCRAVKDDLIRKGIKAEQDYVQDEQLDVRLRGFPEEIAEGIRNGQEWIQLKPENVFVLQDLKEDWIRYAVPMIASCLKALRKKERISAYEDSLVDLGARSFVHVTYGDPDNQQMPDRVALGIVDELFRRAMTGRALATTNNWAKAEVVQPDLHDMFEYDKYKQVNGDILSAGGISGIIVSGRSEDGSTFASAQVSMQTAALRIRQAKDAFCAMMNKINQRLNQGTMAHSSSANIPKFTFPPTDLTGDANFRNTCFRLWKEGTISDETMLKAHGFDIQSEVALKKKELENGTTEILRVRDEAQDALNKAQEEDQERHVLGRPKLDDSERKSDPSHSITGAHAKGSNPDGSVSQEEQEMVLTQS